MYYVYILTNWDDSVLYIGVTGNLVRRLYEHKNGLVDGFTKKVQCSQVGLLRKHKRCIQCHFEREATQKMESKQENRIDSCRKSKLVRSIGRLERTVSA